MNDDSKQIDKDAFLNSPYPIGDDKGMIHFGNRNVELVISMMLGIRNAVNSIGNSEKLFNFVRNDDAFNDFNLFNYTQNTTDRENVTYIYLF